LVRKEATRKVADVAVNEAYDYSGFTFRFYADVLGRSSIDNDNMPLIWSSPILAG
jgi:Zn-dependent metalloprotease